MESDTPQRITSTVIAGIVGVVLHSFIVIADGEKVCGVPCAALEAGVTYIKITSSSSFEACFPSRNGFVTNIAGYFTTFPTEIESQFIANRQPTRTNIVIACKKLNFSSTRHHFFNDVIHRIGFSGGFSHFRKENVIVDPYLMQHGTVFLYPYQTQFARM